MERVFGELTANEVELICKDNKCPLCGSEGFYTGPHAGICTNAKCDCGAIFNVPNVWDGAPFILYGEYMRDVEPVVQAARDARNTFSRELHEPFDKSKMLLVKKTGQQLLQRLLKWSK